MPTVVAAAVTIAMAVALRLTEPRAGFFMALFIPLDLGAAVLGPPLVAYHLREPGTRRLRLSAEELFVTTAAAWASNAGILFVTGALASRIVLLQGIC
jgi:hypothetical protein